MKYKFIKSFFKQEDIFEHYFAIKVNKDFKNLFLPLEKKNNKNELYLHGLHDYEKQINDNLEQFISGYTFNNLLITGAIGCGKTSLIKKTAKKYQNHNLKLIIFNKKDIPLLEDVIYELKNKHLNYKFLIMLDDISFDSSNDIYQSTKSVLEGTYDSIENFMICATSNRRHLTKEIFSNNSPDSDDEDIHPSDLNSDLLSLYDRFGIHIHLYQNNQKVYLELVKKLLTNISDFNFNPEIERMALNWSIKRASRSGRTAKQFVYDYVGKSKLKSK